MSFEHRQCASEWTYYISLRTKYKILTKIYSKFVICFVSTVRISQKGH